MTKGEESSLEESEENKAKKEEKEDKGKKKKVKRHKVKSDSPEPVGMAEDPGDTQVSIVEVRPIMCIIVLCQISAVDSGSRAGPTGTDTSTYEDERGEVLTPTVSAIDAAENPLDRRAMVSLKKQLEIDQPQTSMDFSVGF